METLKHFTLVFAMLLFGMGAYAQNTITATLLDASNDEPVGFATVSLTKKGATKPAKYVLSHDDGTVTIDGVKAGVYSIKAELMGYKPFEKEITVPADSKLGVVKMKTDTQVLDAASVSAAGNPIVMKRDTIEYNATSFKTTENDVLEDLLKKLPGVEVDESGAITVNGETIKKITIDGKTFFLDDPQIASKNIPAKIINKLKVIEKKSDQAEFTGIDDGEEEHVIDLSIKPGMMKGAFGSVMGGAGRDIPSTEVDPATRFQGAGFVGKFTDKTQLSLILNANNTNNRGFNDLSGSMMGGMRGGGRGGMGGGRGGNWGDNGITTSYMGGANGAWTLFDGDMELGGNYMYTNTDKAVEEESSKTTYLQDHNLIYDTKGVSDAKSYGNRFGVRLEHKFSENTSILFEPQVNFGGGNYVETSDYTTRTDLLNGTIENTNMGNSSNGGDNKNFNASGFFLLRQRLGIPGRTLTVMSRYAFSNNEMDGFNISDVYTDYASGKWENDTKINQKVDQQSHSNSVFARATYTEPLGNHFYVEANYSYRYSKSESSKDTWDNILDRHDDTYSNNIINESGAHSFGANMLYQTEKARAQIGFSANPTHTFNSTTRNGATKTYTDDRWKFSPRAMVWWEINENSNFRMFYFGNSEQPSTNQLMPVPDNTDPLNISFGNPSLAPYFSHNMRGEYRFNNKKKFSSVSVRFNGGFVQDPIVNAVWYDNAGAQYSMPFNGPTSANAGVNMFASVPIGKSNFTLNNMGRLNWSKSASYVGDKNLPIEDYYEDGELDYDRFLKAYADGIVKFTENRTQTVSAMDRFRVRYRTDALELALSARTRVNRSWYTISEIADNTTTWNNQIRAEGTWTWDAPGLTLKSEFNYNWYRGYSTEQPSEYILNAEIQKLLFKKKFTLALKGYDILGQAKNLSVTDNANFHNEVRNNTLGRYIIMSLTYRFGTFDRSKMGGMGGMHGPGGPGGRR